VVSEYKQKQVESVFHSEPAVRGSDFGSAAVYSSLLCLP